MSKSIWKKLGEQYDASLARPTAVYVKENDYNLPFFYPTLEPRMGYNYDRSTITMYDIPPRFKIDFLGEYYPNLARNCGANRTLLSNQMTFPGLMRSNFSFTSVGLEGTQWFGQKYSDALTWYADFKCLNCHHRFQKTLITTVYSDEGFEAEIEGNVIKLTFSDFTGYFACSRPVKYVGADTVLTMRSAVENGAYAVPKGKLHVLGMCVEYDEDPEFSGQLAFAFSSVSAQTALKALDASNIEETIAEKYDNWFNSLPVVGNLDADETLAYYKSWAVVRANYYNHPDWGFSITESLPVYKGIWQWAIPSVEWHSDQNPEDNSVWIKKAMDMLVDNMREDGYITHAIYIDEEVPGSRWANGVGTIQCPHLVWTALRYYNITGDLDSIKKWYPAFKAYYNYITRTRDTELKNLHLWAIFSSFDTGLDTTSAFQRVTFGEDGVKENYCYPAIFAAERCRYEQSMAKVAMLLGLDEEADYWTEESKETLEAADEILWDEHKGWYGVLHEDGTLDTRVGIDGLFMLVYGLVSADRAFDMEDGFRKLIGKYGVRTVAADEKGFRANTYWRGPCWPKSLSTGMAAAKKYYPHLVEKVYSGVLNFVLAHPSIWECMNVDTGDLARGDIGLCCTPGMSSNVGAGDILGTMWMYRGIPMYECEMTIPMDVNIKNFHYKGMRISVTVFENHSCITAKAAEASKATVVFSHGQQMFTIDLKDGANIFVRNDQIQF